MIDYADVWRKVENLPWCALVASGRTGSDAFQSQLDSHPEIFVFNGVLFFHEFWNNACTVQNIDEPCIEDIADEFIGQHIRLLKSRYDLQEKKYALGENMDQSINIDLFQFRTHLVNILEPMPINSRNFLMGVYVSYALCLGQGIDNKKLFFHHIHHVRKLEPYISDFPESRIIGMTRDPRAAYVSGVEHWRSDNPDALHPSFPQYILWRIVDELEPAVKYRDRFRVLRLEDLGDEGVLKEICQWLGISFHPCLTKSTWNGLRWWGDNISTAKIKISMSEEEFVTAIRKNNWKERLPPLDQAILNYLLNKRLASCAYKYKTMPPLIYGPLVFFGILLPTCFEKTSLSGIFFLLIQGRFKSFSSVFYHYARRVIYFYRLFFRRHSNRWIELPIFRAPS